jgi:hypothetical protein
VLAGDDRLVGVLLGQSVELVLEGGELGGLHRSWVPVNGLFYISQFSLLILQFLAEASFGNDSPAFGLKSP